MLLVETLQQDFQTLKLCSSSVTWELKGIINYKQIHSINYNQHTVDRCGESLEHFMQRDYVRHFMSRIPMREINSAKDIYAPGNLRKVKYYYVKISLNIYTPPHIFLQDRKQDIQLKKLVLCSLKCTLEEAVHFHGCQFYSDVSEEEYVHVYGAVVDQHGVLVNAEDYVCWIQDGKVLAILMLFLVY